MKRLGKKQLPSLAAIDRIVAVLNVRSSHWTTALCDLRNCLFEYHDSMAPPSDPPECDDDKQDEPDDGLWRPDSDRDAFFGMCVRVCCVRALARSLTCAHRRAG